MSEPPPPPLSCLAQGLIASLKSEPDTWTRNPGYGWYEGVIQGRSGTSLVVWERVLGIGLVDEVSVSIDGHRPPLSKAEQDALRPVIRARLDAIGQQEIIYREKAAQADAARAAAKAQPTIARFEQLGCPTKEPTP